MTYVLDTNIILFLLKDGDTRRFIENQFAPFDAPNVAIISVVTIAEIKAIAKKNGWGERRLQVVETILNRLIVVDIVFGTLLEKYAIIDAFSQGKLFKEKNKRFTSRNMGKNDIWIAATTVLTKAKLLTSDNDFNHLDKEFFEVEIVENLDSPKNK